MDVRARRARRHVRTGVGAAAAASAVAGAAIASPATADTPHVIVAWSAVAVGAAALAADVLRG